MLAVCDVCRKFTFFQNNPVKLCLDAACDNLRFFSVTSISVIAFICVTSFFDLFSAFLLSVSINPTTLEALSDAVAV